MKTMSLSNDHESNKCEEILNEIERETELSKSLQKELAAYKNKQRIIEIVKSTEFTTSRLLQVRVKVFRTFAELLSVLPERVTAEERSSQCLHRPPMDSNIFLIELLVSTAFHNKLVASEWLVDFAIQAGGARKTAKSVTLERNHPANAITAVLAYPRRRQNDEIVKVALTDPMTWESIDLATVATDISFKFTSADEYHPAVATSVEEEIVKINQFYKDKHEKVERMEENAEGSNVIRSDKVLKCLSTKLSRYRLCCRLDGESFSAALMRNAFACLNPEQIVCNEGNRVAKIEINDQRVRLELEDGGADGGNAGGSSSGSGGSSGRSIRMVAPWEELCQLKRYFTRASSCGASPNDAAGSHKWLKRDFHHLQSVNVLKEVRTKLAEALGSKFIDINDLMKYYDVYQRFIDGCPL